MTIDEVLELMDALLDKAAVVPFSSKKCMIEADKMRDYIDQIRFNMPNEIDNAKKMVCDRTEIINQAKKEAENIIKRAEERAKLMISEAEVVKLAKERANDILLNAESKEKDIRIAMTERMDEMLNQTEAILTQNVNDIKQLRSAIRTTTRRK